EAMRNYLLRLGWSHGNDEIISDAQAAEWFDLDHIGKSPSQLDFDKLNFVNHHYIKFRDNNDLFDLIQPILQKKGFILTTDQKSRILAGMAGLKERSKTLIEMANTAEIYIRKKDLDSQAQEKLTQPHAPQVLEVSREVAASIPTWEG